MAETLKKSSNNAPKYRPNVGLMIINKKGEVWLGKRAKTAPFPTNCVEQMPQGGIDTGETPLDAAYRELKEETGLKKDQIILLKISSKWYSYTFPKPILWGNRFFIGQRQKWFLFLHTGSDSNFNLTAYPEEIEFVSFSWVNAKEVPARVIPFKRAVYKKVIEEFRPVWENMAQSTSAD